MRQAFYEYIENMSERYPIFSNNKLLEKIGYFIFDLRNAFLHTKGKLIPHFTKKTDKKIQPILKQTGTLT